MSQQSAETECERERKPNGKRMEVKKKERERENQRNRGNPAIGGLFARKAERAHTVGTRELEADHAI